MMTRVLGETAWSCFWTSRPLITDIQISRTARATELQITYERKRSGSLNNCACKPTDKSKRSSALSIEGSSSMRQIMPAAGGERRRFIVIKFIKDQILNSHVCSNLHPPRIELKPRPSDGDQYRPSEGR